MQPAAGQQQPPAFFSVMQDSNYTIFRKGLITTIYMKNGY